ncbi:MAG: DUF2889 domain-containing protein [Sulfuritalea sp.]|jgi:hypothetical protein|nr:DUF2889 domain-containing protein [Sulfuritalea sp.]
MPLPAAAVPRTRIHTRRILLEGWRRDDGLWDIEARLTDVKDHDYHLASGVRLKGDPVHDLWVRVTIDRDMNIRDAVASSDTVPYPGGCDTIVPAYRQLIGRNLFRGFRREVGELFATVRGCSHLTELLNSLPTAAIQTFASEMSETGGRTPGAKPFQLDQCHALATTSETVRQYYPRWFRSNKTGT